MTNATIEIEIDGKKLDVEPGSMVIEAADEAGIPIPRFCYHKKLSVAANCRMCLVEVEKVGKPLPACATPVTAGMKVFTQSEKARIAQRSVMEFLLINHPLDCPICDQGGECELQDLSMGYGQDITRFSEGKRSVANEDMGPLVATEMTRCIQCTRCVRFGEEISGVRELGTLGRGEHLWIGTYIKQSLTSEISANIIDLCPVGALTSKPFQFTARAWELTQHPSIAPHDCLGSNLFIHSRKQEVMRVVPRENEKINETWLSDRDRFSYLGIHSHKRLTKPLVKISGEWQEVEWDIALRTVVAKISGVLDLYEPSQLAALISPNSTIEEMYLLQKILRKLGSNNIDHRLHQSDFSDQDDQVLMPTLTGMTLEEMEEQETILIFGSHLNHEQPLAAVRVRKAIQQGAQVFSINAMDYDFAFDLAGKIIENPTSLPTTLASLIQEVANITAQSLPEFFTASFSGKNPSETIKRLAKRLVDTKRNSLLLGELAQNHPNASTIRTLSQLLSTLIPLKLAFLTFGANSAGAWMAGVLPHRQAAGQTISTPGLTIHDALEKKLKAYILFGIEPGKDLAFSSQALAAFSEAETLIAFTSFSDRVLMERAHVILPISVFAETSGTFINVAGTWQTFRGAVTPRGEIRPGWKVLRALANFFGFDEDFRYTSSEMIRDELQQLTPASPSSSHPQTLSLHANFSPAAGMVSRIIAWPLYQTDSLVRHAEALQATPLHESPRLHLNQKTADKFALSAGEMAQVNRKEIILPVHIDASIPDDCVYIPAGFEETAGLSVPFGEILLEKASA
ncbi:MAG: NADH-quinone oxidoreductase subunit G [Gammaproteobacteria bacterium]|nr:NADH-quinone oxidoreductase subunit G [Gammaproteobacteria bacterium]